MITSISRDHQRQLGETLAEIAREKAGIVKHGVPVVSGVRTPETAAVIEQVCERQSAPLFVIDRDFQAESGDSRSFRFAAKDSRYGCLDGLAPGMPGAAQIDNAAVAVAVAVQLRLLGAVISDDAVRSGIAAARCAGRLETLIGEPSIVLDVAHNDASALELAAHLQARFSGQPLTLVLAVSRDKQLDDVLRPLTPLAQRVIVTRYKGNPRWTPPEELAARWADLGGTPAIVRDDLNRACDMAFQEASAQGVICLTGSFFLVGEARAYLRRRGVQLASDAAGSTAGDANQGCSLVPSST